MKIHVLDVGDKIYGDSILVVHNGRSILIDGAHRGDDDLILGQLSEVLGEELPIAIDLLVVTHCHSDHIGCLPELVMDGKISVRRALLSDPELGFAPSGEDSEDAAPRPRRSGCWPRPFWRRIIHGSTMRKSHSSFPTRRSSSRDTGT